MRLSEQAHKGDRVLFGLVLQIGDEALIADLVTRLFASQEHLDAVARELNERPRMTLNYVSLAEKFDECVASIG